jgi:hypothetical protein
MNDMTVAYEFGLGHYYQAPLDDDERHEIESDLTLLLNGYTPETVRAFRDLLTHPNRWIDGTQCTKCAIGNLERFDAIARGEFFPSRAIDKALSDWHHDFYERCDNAVEAHRERASEEGDFSMYDGLSPVESLLLRFGHTEKPDASTPEFQFLIACIDRYLASQAQTVSAT